MPTARSTAKTTSARTVPTEPAAAPRRRVKRSTSTDPAERVAALRTVLFDTIEAEVEAGNVRVILWLADRLRLLDVAERQQGPADELRALLDALPPAELKELASLAGQ